MILILIVRFTWFNPQIMSAVIFLTHLSRIVSTNRKWPSDISPCIISLKGRNSSSSPSSCLVSAWPPTMSGFGCCGACKDSPRFLIDFSRDGTGFPEASRNSTGGAFFGTSLQVWLLKYLGFADGALGFGQGLCIRALRLSRVS
eukprot:Gregarina_sp_Poly_1__334@NODE_107_length_14129_cov_139_662779_g94_i0_p9_GENE_NODE_107_length_14129_cov_139_662779_g94_i0NODE_107_length_14129_cov_139_662779_g94_i0_p9_ORF_typecomplete_len144_score1_04DUF2651/PF10852_8/0_061_NODE_107_length_14129_cov_139_662779_g94_i067777208